LAFKRLLESCVYAEIRIEVGKWTFGIEDYLFAFAYGGLAAGIFDIV
jgi:hypothetical protein